MFENIIGFFIRNKFATILFVTAWIVAGVYAMTRLAVDAVPDITNNQVQVVTVSPSYAPQEVEQIVTFPIEVALTNLPGIVEVRSISRYGLSVVTAVFEDDVPILDARQHVREQITAVGEEFPAQAGKPQLMPITTGLGEIFQYVLRVDSAHAEHYSPTRLRTIQDWVVKRGMAGIPGVVEISSFGGFLKQVEVAVNPKLAASLDITLDEVVAALEKNNENTSGGYITSGPDAWYIRAEGIAKKPEDLLWIQVGMHQGNPVLLRHIAEVKEGHALRFGAMTADGKGEAVGGIALMLKGANSSDAIDAIHQRVKEVQQILPTGVHLEPFLDRSKLVGRTTSTVRNNLLEGGLIVVLVLVLLLGNLRAGLIVASVIPLSMLFAFFMMHLFGVSANLMSLGAVDFGIVVDGAVIIVEAILHHLHHTHAGKKLTRIDLEEAVRKSTARIYQAAAFGVLIILVVFLPVLSLTGIEGKMFRPMAQTVSFAILGALILSLTYVPMVTSMVLRLKIPSKANLADRFVAFLVSTYQPSLRLALRFKVVVAGLAVALFMGSVFLMTQLGAEFIPTLEEGDLAMQMTLPAGSTLDASIKATTQAERILMSQFPEVEHVVSKIGTAEIPTDPMAVEDADIMIVLKEKAEWKSAHSREELVMKMKGALEAVPRASFEFTQPIQLRFNELMTGAKADVAVKIFGPNLGTLARLGREATQMIAGIPGAADVKLDQTEGLPQLRVVPDRQALAQYGMDIRPLNELIRTAYLGTATGVMFEDERRFDVVVRADSASRADLQLDQLFLPAPNGTHIPLRAVASIDTIKGPLMVSREKAQRRIVIGVNVRGRDVGSLVEDIQKKLSTGLDLPPGYRVEYGGQFENLQAAKKRFAIALPVALLLIFLLLYASFGSIKHALLIYAAVPLSAIGGIAALWLRDMPFSISAGIGFIALFGVAVLNGIVLISHFNHLKATQDLSADDLVVSGASDRFRPVLMTALVASLGFLPMAISNSAGAEVQRPLATVVIGGLITASFLTLVLLPVLYTWMERGIRRKAAGVVVAGLVMLLPLGAMGQSPISLPATVAHAQANHPDLRVLALQLRQAEASARAAFNPPQPTVDLTYGQINTRTWDYQLQVSQGTGNVRAQLAQSNYAHEAIRLAEVKQQLAQRQVAYEVQQAWNRWLHARQRLARLAEQQAAWDKQLLLAEQRFDAGDISGMEKALILSANQKAMLALQRARVEMVAAEQSLREAAFLGAGALVPDNDTLVAIAQPTQTNLSGRLVAEAEANVQQSQAGVRLAAAQRFPEMRVGYFNQQIDRSPGFNGVLLGLSVPIWGRAVQATKEVNELQVKVAESSLEQQRIILDQQLTAAWVQLAAKESALQTATEAAAGSTKLRMAAEVAVKTGEISYFELFQYMVLTQDLELERLQALFEYNQTALFIQFLTQQ